MDVTVTYSMASLHEAANYIWENNPYVLAWPSSPRCVHDVVEQIKDMMYRSVMENASVIKDEMISGKPVESKWQSFSGSGGIYCLYSLEDATADGISIFCNILVDPSVLHFEKGYVKHQLTNNSNKPII